MNRIPCYGSLHSVSSLSCHDTHSRPVAKSDKTRSRGPLSNRFCFAHGKHYAGIAVDELATAVTVVENPLDGT